NTTFKRCYSAYPTGKGGSIQNAPNATLSVLNTTFYNSRSQLYPGGRGGAIYADTNSDITLQNCTITSAVADFAAAQGGVVYVRSGTAAIQNCTITGNSTISLRLGAGATATLESTILAGPYNGVYTTAGGT